MTTPLTPDLIAVSVPMEAKIFRVNYAKTGLDGGNGKYTELWFTNGKSQHMGALFVEYGTHDILGYVTADEISFDVEPYVECLSKPNGLYKSYLHDSPYAEHHSKSANDSFRSLLQSKDIHFVNPLGGEFCNLNKKGLPTKEWQSAQSKLWQKAVIIKRK